MDEHQRAQQVLNRFAFGPRPGDGDRVAAMGVDKWFEQQLNPQRIEEREVEARLAPLRTLKMSTRELVENFPPPQLLKAVAEGKRDLPRDPEKRAVYEAALERYRFRQQNKQDKDNNNAAQQPENAGDMQDDDITPAQRQERRTQRQQASELADRMQQLAPDARMKAILAMPAEQRDTFVRALSQLERLSLVDGMSPQQKETLVAMFTPQGVVVGELMQAKLLRAVYSERQLQEVMADFWFNHFNVFIGKGPDRYMINAYERDVIRPNALGKFRDLLIATAKGPAMLFYLDNWQSVGPNSEFAQYGPGGRQLQFAQRGNARQRQRAAAIDNKEQFKQIRKNAPKGLNENYAREVMELHTLGVNGGYTQKDVTELARVLTGWSIRKPREGADGFDFNARMHEPGDKVVLGRKFKDDGEKEGVKALEMLAQNPATAKFISRKLAMRFVSDNPPDALVDRMAETFQRTDGDIREVLRTLFRSQEFWAKDTYRAKVKTPFEFVVSALRATGADMQAAGPVVQTLNKMGMPLYGAQPPTGYSMKAETWVNSAALLSRMNFALALGAGRLPGLKVDTGRLVPDDRAQADAAQAMLEQSLLGGDVSRQTHDTIQKQLHDPQLTGGIATVSDGPTSAGVLAGLILGSPEFQRR